MSHCYSSFLALCRCVLYGERERNGWNLASFLASADNRQCGWQGQGSTVAWLVHSSPLHPTRCTSTHTVSGRAQCNNNISLLHSLLAISKGLIQRITASPYLHTNKKGDVDSYRCLPTRPPPLRACTSLVICQISSFKNQKMKLWGFQIRKATLFPEGY